MTDTQNATPSPVGETLARNIHRIREAQRLTYVELSKRLADAGRPIPVLGLRRIERGDRRIDADDLLALAYVLQVFPVDLLVPSDAQDDVAYKVAPEVVATAETARKWIAGHAFLERPSMAGLAVAFQFMPTKRAQELGREWLGPEDERTRQLNRVLEQEEGRSGVWVDGKFQPFEDDR